MTELSEVDRSARPRVTVVLPVFNEAAHAAAVVAEVAAFGRSHAEYRFIFVDDGSSDGTGEIIQSEIVAHAAKDPRLTDRARVIRCRSNAGKGFAVMLGVMAATGGERDLVLFTDGDLAYSLDHLPALVDALSEADVVIGSRRGPDGGYRAHPARNVMGWAYNRMARVCLGARFRDTQAGLKGFRLGAARRIFGVLRVTGFAFDAEVLYLARRLRYRIAEVPATVSPWHRRQPTSVNLWRDPRRMFVCLLGIRLSGALGHYERPLAGRRPLAVLSFDAEEFDLPTEYGTRVPLSTQLSIAAEGMRRTLELLDDIPARATFFTTVAFAEAHPELILQAVARGHEIASHSMAHSVFNPQDPAQSRLRLEAITGSPVLGFRRPRFAPTDPAAIAGAGYRYDSSVHPIWLPGRYNGLRWPRRVFCQSGLVRIPPSTTPLVRFPLFWLAFKNAPQWCVRSATRWALSSDGYAALYFHPWELCDLHPFGLPRYIRRISGRRMQSRLTRYLRWLSRRAEFVTFGELEGRFRAGRWPFGSVPAAPSAPDLLGGPTDSPAARCEVRVRGSDTPVEASN